MPWPRFDTDYTGALHAQAHQGHGLQGLGFHVLQQPSLHSRPARLLPFLVEDWSAASLERNFPEDGRYLLLAAIAVSGAAAVGISFTTAWCVRVTGSTTYSMV